MLSRTSTNAYKGAAVLSHTRTVRCTRDSMILPSPCGHCSRYNLSRVLKQLNTLLLLCRVSAYLNHAVERVFGHFYARRQRDGTSAPVPPAGTVRDFWPVALDYRWLRTYFQAFFSTTKVYLIVLTQLTRPSRAVEIRSFQVMSAHLTQPNERGLWKCHVFPVLYQLLYGICERCKISNGLVHCFQRRTTSYNDFKNSQAAERKT